MHTTLMSKYELASHTITSASTSPSFKLPSKSADSHQLGFTVQEAASKSSGPFMPNSNMNAPGNVDKYDNAQDKAIMHVLEKKDKNTIMQV